MDTKVPNVKLDLIETPEPRPKTDVSKMREVLWGPDLEQFDRMTKLVADLKYKPGYVLDVYHTATERFQSTPVRIIFDVVFFSPNSLPESLPKRILIGHRYEFSVLTLQMMSDDMVLQSLFYHILVVERHEAGEFYQYKGKRIFLTEHDTKG